jgi:chromate transporter
VALYIGYRRAGWRGPLIAGACFILPAALIVTAMAWGYVRFGRLPAVGGALYGIKAVIIAIVAQALVAFARSAPKSSWLAVLALGAAVASVLGAPPVAILVTAGCANATTRAAWRPSSDAAFLVWTGGGASIAHGATGGLGKLFLIFVKVGAVVFGSGYVLLALLRADLVERTHWLTEGQLIDAVAVGQFTPGPVFTTATFIGYVVAGLPGATVATIGIFLPSFVLIAVSGPLIPRLRRSALAGAFLDGLNVASLALMAVVGVRLAKSALVDVPTISLAAASALALLRWRINSAWLVLGGGVIGAAVQWLR